MKSQLVLLTLMFLALTACSPPEDSSLLGSAFNSQFCPPGCVQETKAGPDSLFVKIENSGSLMARLGGRLDLSGQCRTLYSNSRISFKVFLNSNAATVAYLRTFDIEFGVAPVAGQAGFASCRDGRFEAAFVLDNVPAGSHMLVAEIESMDEAGKKVTNANQGQSRLPLQIIP